MPQDRIVAAMGKGLDVHWRSMCFPNRVLLTESVTTSTYDVLRRSPLCRGLTISTPLSRDETFISFQAFWKFTFDFDADVHTKDFPPVGCMLQWWANNWMDTDCP
eukprot:1159491-Pelagomonas_calceolata.AAC.29